MPYSIAVQEKEEFIRKLFEKLPKSVVAGQAKQKGFDAGIDGWIFNDKASGKKLASLVGFGDKVTTHDTKVVPYWLDKLVHQIKQKYPSDGIYINGKIYTTIQEKTLFLNSILKPLGYKAVEQQDDSWFGGWIVTRRGIRGVLAEFLIAIPNADLKLFNIDRDRLDHKVVLALAKAIQAHYGHTVELEKAVVIGSPSFM